MLSLYTLQRGLPAIAGLLVEIIIAILHCLSDCVVRIGILYTRSCKCCRELGFCLASIAHVTCAKYRTISGRRNNRKVADSATDITISPI